MKKVLMLLVGMLFSVPVSATIYILSFDTVQLAGVEYKENAIQNVSITIESDDYSDETATFISDPPEDEIDRVITVKSWNSGSYNPKVARFPLVLNGVTFHSFQSDIILSDIVIGEPSSPTFIPVQTLRIYGVYGDNNAYTQVRISLVNHDMVTEALVDGDMSLLNFADLATGVQISNTFGIRFGVLETVYENNTLTNYEYGIDIDSVKFTEMVLIPASEQSECTLIDAINNKLSSDYENNWWDRSW